jgi:hypothetical protein
MELPTVIFENNYRAAHAVRDYIDSLYPGGHRFTTRPYQYQAPEFTHWWFVPSTDWPAYRHSKLFIRQVRRGPEYLYTGYRVERGLGQQLATVPDVRREHVMQPNWYWFEFLRRAQAGELDAPVRDVMERSKLPVIVSMDLWEFNHAPMPDEEPGAPDDYIEFAIRSKDLQFETAMKGTKILRQVNECVNLRELAQHFDGWEEIDWYWVDLFIGIRLRYGNEETGTWRAAQIWRNALEPWATWVH